MARHKSCANIFLPLPLHLFVILLLSPGIVQALSLWHRFQQLLHDTPPSPPEQRTIIGIHLGATYASVGVFRNNSFEIIPDKRGNRVIPNVVRFTHIGALIGDESPEIEVDAANTVFDIDHIIGKNFNDKAVQDATKHLPFEVVDVNGAAWVRVNGKNQRVDIAPEDVTAMMLERLKNFAVAYLGKNVKEAIVAVPAYFNPAQRAAMQKAGDIAGLTILRVINAPVAAALAYELDNYDVKDASFRVYERNILVYSLESRAFSASIVVMEEGVFEIFSTVGDSRLGSAHFTDHEFSLTMKLVDEALNESKMKKSELTDIVFIGGSEEVHFKLQDYFGITPHEGINPHEVVTHGAAFQAYILSSYSDCNGCCGLLMDVSFLTLGIETTSGLVYSVVKRGTTWPTKKTGIFTTAIDDQESVLIRVFEGERPYTNSSLLVGEFQLTGIPPAKKGIPEIKVTLDIDQHFKIRVTATHTQRSASLIMYGDPSLETIEQIIEEAEAHREEDEKVKAQVQNAIETDALKTRAMATVERDSVCETGELWCLL